MFGRFAKNIYRLLPLSALFTSYLLNQSQVKLSEQTKTIKQSLSQPITQFVSDSRIKFVDDLTAYIEKQSVYGKSVIFFQMRGDSFIDEQVVKLARQFIKTCSNKISEDYQFIFLKNNSQPYVDQQNYLILYGPSGEKVINIDSYLNKNKQKPNLQISNKMLMRKLLEGLNRFKEVSLENISEELNSIELSSNYAALFTIASDKYAVQKAKNSLQKYLKLNDIKAKVLNKFVVKDTQTQRILGLAGEKQTDNKVFLLIPDTANLKTQFRNKANFFSINGKRFTYLDASSNFDNVFVFPPVHPIIEPQQLVLNVYINKNKDSGILQSKLYQELAKPQYDSYVKGLYYSGQIEGAALTLQMNEYSSASLKAYQPNTKMSKGQMKYLLNNTFQWNYNILNQEEINTESIAKWIQEAKGPNKLEKQYFKSQKITHAWAQQITGEQYKKIRDSPFDKVIYHYSHHCHGCKKFGGKYEEFARDRKSNTPNIHFYRINNDHNKSEGVRNFNSTPVFVFYKKNNPCPFVYRMSIFTEALFDAFLKITEEVKLIDSQPFQNHIAEHMKVQPLVNEFVSQVTV